MRGPRILLVGGTYRALCVLEHLLERGERVVAFLGQEGAGERDFCPEILELCDRHAIPARSGRKIGEEVVRWLDDRIRPDLVISVGITAPLPLAVGGNCRLGLLEVLDGIDRDERPTLALRLRGQEIERRELKPLDAEEDPGDLYLRWIDQMLEALDQFLARVAAAVTRRAPSLPYHVDLLSPEARDVARARPDPGPDTDALERELGAYTGASHTLALRSESGAWTALLEALGVGPGQEVICPALAPGAALEAVRRSGARPVLIDVDPERLTLHLDWLADAIGPRTRALLVAHPLGQPAPLDRVYALAHERHLEVLEAGEESLGACFAGAPLGGSPCTCLFRLPLGAGDPAVLLTLSPELEAHVRPGLERSRLPDGQAALARQLLGRLDETLARRRRSAARYTAALARYDAFRVPPSPTEALGSHSGYLLRLTRFARTTADDLHQLLAESGIETRRLELPVRERDLARLPTADAARASGLLLPIGPGLCDDEQDLVLDTIFGYAIG